jgi:HK97 family phage portal protein
MALFPALEHRVSTGVDRSPTSDFWYQLVDYIKTGSGVTISEQSAMGVTAVYACINLISRHIGSMPLHVFEDLGDERTRPATEHSNFALLHTRPNPEMTPMSYRSTVQAHSLGWGTSYSNIEWTAGYRKVKWLWPLSPSRIQMRRDPSSGELEYLYTLPGGEQRKLPARDVLRINGLGYNGLTGYSPIMQGKEAIGLSMAAEKHGSLFFSNGAIPGLALTHPGKLSDTAHEHLRKSWEESHAGLDNKHRLAILEEGLKIEKIGIDPELAQLLETRRFQIEEIARLFNIPLHKISDLSRATFNNIEHLSQEYLTDCLLPYAVQNEQSYDYDLFIPKDRGRYFTKHNFEGLLRGDSQARAEFYRTMFNIGAFSPNMILGKENMNPIGDEGDFHMVQLNMVPLKTYLNAPAPVLPEPKTPAALLPADDTKSRSLSDARADAVKSSRLRLRDRHYPLFKETLAQVVTRETNTVKRYVEKYLRNDDKDGFTTHIDDFYSNTFPEYVRMKLSPVMGVYADAIASAARGEVGTEQTEDSDSTLSTFVTDYISTYVTRHIQSSRGQINSILLGKEARDDENGGDATYADSDIPDAIEGRMNEWDEKRPDKDAQDETVRLDGAIAVAVFIESGFRLKWVAVGTSCPYCEMLNGMVVGRDGYFLNQDQELQPPGQPPMHIRFSKRHPPAHHGCDCMIMAAQ